MDPRQNLAKHTNILVDHYKRREIENRRRDKEENILRIKKEREDDLINMQEKTKQ